MDKTVVCSKCGSVMKYYDRVKRVVRLAYGSKKNVYIKRYSCRKCGSVCRILPEHILPYKHYEKKIIEGFVLGRLTSELLEYEDYPCETTIANWKRYFDPPTFI